MKTRPLRSGLKWFKVKFVNVTFPPVFFFLWTENKKTKRWALHSSVSLLFFALCYWPLRAQTELLPFVFPAPSPSTLLLHLHLPSAMWVIRGLVIVSGLVFLADILHLYPDSLIKRKFIVCLSAVYSSSTTNKLTPSWSEGETLFHFDFKPSNVWSVQLIVQHTGKFSGMDARTGTSLNIKLRVVTCWQTEDVFHSYTHSTVNFKSAPSNALWHSNFRVQVKHHFSSLTPPTANYLLFIHTD